MATSTTVTAPASNTTSSLTNMVNRAKSKKALGLGGLITAGMCIFDFWEVPGAFSIKNDYEGKPVEGLNISAGTKEILWSTVKCASAFALPWVIGMIATPFAPVAATVAAAAKLAAPLLSYAALDAIRPHEKEVIEKICEAKGIDINNPGASSGMSTTGTMYA